MKTIPRDLETLSFKELSALQTKIAALSAKRYEESTALIREKVAKLAADLGVKTEEVFGTPLKNGTHKPRKGKVAIKFRDPSHPENTWTGRGRQPRWLAAAVKQGARLEQFRVGA